MRSLDNTLSQESDIEILKDEGFREITKEDINKFYKELKNKDFWGTEEELFKLLEN